MTRTFGLAAVLACITVAACNGPTNDIGTNGPEDGFGAAVELDGVKATTLAEIAYNEAASTALAGVQNGDIKDDAAEKVSRLNDDALMAITNARAARDGEERVAAAGRALNDILELHATVVAAQPRRLVAVGGRS